MQGTALLYLNGPDTLAYNITLSMPFDNSDQLESILLSVPQFINTSAVTLGFFYGANATGKPQVVRTLPVHSSARLRSGSTRAHLRRALPSLHGSSRWQRMGRPSPSRQ